MRAHLLVPCVALLAVGCPTESSDDLELTLVEILEIYNEVYGPDSDFNQVINEVIQVVDATRVISDPLVTDTIELSEDPSVPEILVLQPGSFLPLYMEFTATNRDLSAVGVRFGASEDIQVIDLPSAVGYQLGTPYVSVELDDGACSVLPSGCSTAVFQLFGINVEGAVSEPLLVDVVFRCGDCDDATCAPLLECPV